MNERYKGRWVDPRVHELRDGSGWTAEVYIAEDDGADNVDARLQLRGEFPTREAALASAMATGKREVDKRSLAVDIASVIQQETRLPSTHRHGFGSHIDDVAQGADGMPTKVPTPENPDDRFS